MAVSTFLGIESNIAQQFENKFLHVNAQLETEASNRKMDYLNITTQRKIHYLHKRIVFSMCNVIFLNFYPSVKDFKDFVAHRQNVTNNDLAMGFMEVFEQISELSANHSQGKLLFFFAVQNKEFLFAFLLIQIIQHYNKAFTVM